MKLSVLIHMTNGLGYGTNVGFMYKFSVVNGDFSLRKIEIEDDVVDMAAIGKQNGSVELHITQANNIAFLDSEVGQLGEIAEGDNEDSEGDSGSFDGEEFHDSDYDFCKDDDDVIYNQSVATIGRDLSIVLGIKEVGHEEQGIEEPEQHEPHEPDKSINMSRPLIVIHFAIKTMGPPHQCGRTFYNKRVTSTFLSKTYVEFLRLNRKVTVGEFQENVHRELNANITRHQMYKTFQKSKILIYGKYKKQYSKIWEYYEELLEKNPGSTVDIFTVVDEISEKERCQRMYIYFEALKRGFREGCRPVVGVDGCHLRGLHPGILLTAIGIDPNDCIYPIAYAVVEIENKNSWRWFIEHLKYDLGIYDQQSWTFISDRQKGLGFAMHEVLPRIEHRHFTHMYGEKFVVDLEKQVCDCRRWELTGIPCSLAVCCISLTGEEPESFVNQCYSKDAYVRAYEPAIEPMNGPNAWPNSKRDPIHAPKKLKLPGRPKKSRRREPDEQTSDPKGIKKLSRVGITLMTCLGCHQKGHTVRKCPQRLIKEELVVSSMARGPSINSNKCSKCYLNGHNIRSCPGEQVEESSMHVEMPHMQAGESNMQAEMQHMQAGESNVQAEMAYMQAEESNMQAKMTSILPEVQGID
ncbi:hypothetical protein ACH5RR_036737 [Cinchona calisaya]|uniref:CCHC-type domain-containing protein n=1 Tax=Cinchona calisaya TaxID=153742 RepID=A0ABD2Y444_9GENT